MSDLYTWGVTVHVGAGTGEGGTGGGQQRVRVRTKSFLSVEDLTRLRKTKI